MWRHKLKDRDVGRFNSATQEYLESWLEKRRISFTPRQVISGTGEQLSLRKVLSNTPLVCLTGGSGFGKSVLAVDAARSIAYTGTPEGKTVLYLDTTQLGPLDIDSPDNLTRWACQYGSVGSKFGTDFIEKRLRSESNTCIIDGIDEVMGIEKRFRLHNWISSLTQAYHSHFCVVSSSAFITDPIRRRFEEFRVAPLDNDSITEILRPELQRNAAYSGLDVQDQINTFWNYLEGIDYEHLLRNPSFIILAGVMQGAIPRCVDELFAEGIKTYLNAARCHKDSHEGNLWKTLEYPKDIQSIFYEMAFNLYSRGSRSMSVEDICSSEKWNDIYKNTKSSVKQPFTKEERKALIRELALTSPFFGYSNIQDGQYPYQFTNLAVQEYMAGRELIRAIERLNTDRKQITVDYIAEAIIKITDHDPLWWRQPLICACSDTDLGTHVMAFLLKTGIEDLIADAYFFGKHNPLDPKVSDQFQGAYEKKYGPKKPTQ